MTYKGYKQKPEIMKTYRSCIYLFGLLLCLGSCSSSEEITLEQAQIIQDYRPYVVLNTPKRNYHLYDFSLTADSLTGFLYPAKNGYGNYLHFYTNERVYGKVNKRTHPYFAIHISKIYKTESRFDSGDEGFYVYLIMEILFCAVMAL